MAYAFDGSRFFARCQTVQLIHKSWKEDGGEGWFTDLANHHAGAEGLHGCGQARGDQATRGAVRPTLDWHIGEPACKCQPKTFCQAILGVGMVYRASWSTAKKQQVAHLLHLYVKNLVPSL